MSNPNLSHSYKTSIYVYLFVLSILLYSHINYFLNFKKFITILIHLVFYTMDHHLQQQPNQKQQHQAAKPRNKFLNLLPKSASIVAFHQNPPYSPNRDKRTELNKQLKSNMRKGFSGPLIPEEVRRKSKSGNFENQGQEEPTSPKVSCIGQIKLKKKLKKTQGILTSDESKTGVKNTGSAMRRIFSSIHRKSDASILADNKVISMVPSENRAPSLGQMKRFASGRDHHLSNLDWTAHITPLDRESDGEGEEIKIPFSAPLGVGGLGLPVQKPKKEINIWKRRTMAPPRPLQLDSL